MLSLSRDPVTNTSGLTIEQLSSFKKLEELTGTGQEERVLPRQLLFCFKLHFIYNKLIFYVFYFL